MLRKIIFQIFLYLSLVFIIPFCTFEYQIKQNSPDASEAHRGRKSKKNHRQCKSMKKLTLTAQLRRNLRMGKTCRIRFQKIDGGLTWRWVKAIPAGLVKGTGKSNPKTICFFDIEKEDIICCRTENLYDVETKTQYEVRLAKKAASKERAGKAREIARFYDISLSEGFLILFNKKELTLYESEANQLEKYELSESYNTLCYGL